MLQLNLLLPATPDATHAPVTANLVPATLPAALLDPETGEPMAFAAELHALLMALSPEQVDRLQGLLQGGMSLPQAASAVLAEQPGGQLVPPVRLPVDGSPSATTLPLPEPVTAEPVGAETLPRHPLAAAMEALLGGEHAEFRPSHAPIPAALPEGGVAPVLRGPLAALLSGPLGSNLLAMGVPQRVGSPEWADAVSDRVFWMAQGGQQFARLQLNPPNLGPLEVRLNLSQDQASVSFVAGQAAVREALEAALPRLRDMFDQQSLLLVRAEVRDHGSGAGQQAGDSNRGGAGGAGTASAGPGLPAAQSAASAVTVSDRLVDLFA